MLNATPCQPIGNDDGQYLGALTKKCSKCGEEKSLTSFCRLPRSKDGRYPSCKECESAVTKAYYEKNREKVIAAVREYATENREKVLESKRNYYKKDPKGFTAKTTAYARAHKEQCNAYKKKWLEANPEKRRESANGWYASNKEQASEYRKTRYELDPKKYNAATRDWQSRNKERVSANAKRWREENLDRSRATVRRRRAKMRYVQWADDARILEVYSEALRLTEETGVKHEVDHVFPVSGRTVTGLHVAENLRAVPCSVNRSKNNKLPGHLAHELWDPEGLDVYYPENSECLMN